MNTTSESILQAKKRRERGTALVAVVSYLAIVGILGAGFFVAVNRAIDDAHARESRVACRAIAEGGVEKALVMLRNDPAYRGEADTPLGDGFVTVRIEPQADGAYRLVSIGRLADGPPLRAQRTLTAEVVLADGRVVLLRWLEESAR